MAEENLHDIVSLFYGSVVIFTTETQGTQRLEETGLDRFLLVYL